MLISSSGISEISRKVGRIQINGGHVGVALGASKVILIQGRGFLCVVVSGQVAVAGWWFWAANVCLGSNVIVGLVASVIVGLGGIIRVGWELVIVIEVGVASLIGWSEVNSCGNIWSDLSGKWQNRTIIVIAFA